MTRAGPSPRARWLLAAALAAVAFLLQVPSFRFGPVLDDAALLADAAQVEDAWDLFGRGLFAGVRPYGGYYRPLTALSFHLEARLGLGMPGRHALNAALHAAASAGAFLLLSGILGGLAVPLAAGALFAVHPVHLDAVLPVTGRGDLLAAAFGLAAWGAFRARRAGRGGRAALPAAAVLFGAALLAKESAAALPLLLAAGEWTAARADRRELRRRPGDYVVLLAVLGLYLLLRTAVLGRLVEPGLPDPLDNPLAGAGIAARLAAAPAAWLEAARLLVWPHPLPPDYSGESLRATGAGLPAAAGWAVALALAAAWLGTARRPGAPFLGLSILLATYLAVANLVLLAPVLLAARLLYLPSLGATLLLAAAGLGGERAGRVRRWIGGACLAGLALAWTVLLLAGQARYADDLRLWGEAARLTPRNAKAWYNLGNARTRAGAIGPAAEAYARAVEEAPDLAIGWSNLGATRARLDREAEARAAFERALHLDPGLSQAHAGLGSLLLRAGEQSAGLRHLRLSLALDPDQPDAEAIRALLGRAPDPGRPDPVR